MPWCEDCSKFWNPNSMPPDGTCPTCGNVIAEPPDQKVPWHFWILVVGVVVYLGWRLVQLFQWLFGNGYAAIGIPLMVLTVALLVWFAVWLFRRDPSEALADHPDTEP